MTTVVIALYVAWLASSAAKARSLNFTTALQVIFHYASVVEQTITIGDSILPAKARTCMPHIGSMPALLNLTKPMQNWRSNYLTR